MPLSPRLPHKVPVIQAKLKRKCALFLTVVVCIQDLSVRKKSHDRKKRQLPVLYEYLIHR